MDAVVTHWINGLAGQPVWDAILRAASAYGVPVMVALVALNWVARHDRRHVRHVAVVAGLAFLLGLALNQGVLLWVHRVRPYDAGVTQVLIARSADWSFPSDHATAAVAMVLAFCRKGLWGRGAVLLGLAGLICVSRVYLGIHYAGDILGGAVTGALAVGLVGLVYREGSRLDRFVTALP